LLHHIANYVTQKQPTTITELLDAAHIAELTHPVAVETDTAVTAQLAGVQEQLRQVKAKWDSLVVASVNRPDESNRSRTHLGGSPKKGTFFRRPTVFLKTVRHTKLSVTRFSN